MLEITSQQLHVSMVVFDIEQSVRNHGHLLALILISYAKIISSDMPTQYDESYSPLERKTNFTMK